MANCIPLALDDKKLNDRQRQEVVQDYGSKAVAYIRDGVQKGFKNIKELKEDPSYKPLRERADFQKLLQEFDRGTAVGVG
jgi:hypothetical protein